MRELNFVRDAYAHLKVIGFIPASKPLLDLAGALAYIAAAKHGRLWARAAAIPA